MLQIYKFYWLHFCAPNLANYQNSHRRNQIKIVILPRLAQKAALVVEARAEICVFFHHCKQNKIWKSHLNDLYLGRLHRALRCLRYSAKRNETKSFSARVNKTNITSSWYRYIVWEPRSTREIGNYNYNKKLYKILLPFAISKDQKEIWPLAQRLMNSTEGRFPPLRQSTVSKERVYLNKS